MSHAGHGVGGGIGGIVIRENPFLAEVYWMFAGGFIAIATLVNLKEYIEFRIRFVFWVRAGAWTDADVVVKDATGR